MTSLQKVLDYWFEKPNDYQKWFFSGKDLDGHITDVFGNLLDKTIQTKEPVIKLTDKVAKIILLDQFSRHIYRGTANSFASDNISLVISKSLLQPSQLIEFNKLPAIYKMFALMPLQHSENIDDKNTLLDWINSQLDNVEADQNIYKSLIEHTNGHKQVLEKYGRYPKRNIALGRTSTLDELDYIKNNPNGAY